MLAPYMSKEECCGCGVCAENCKKDAIHMLEDEEGFLYPSVDEGKCVNCGVCIKVCGFKYPPRISFEQKYWALKSKDEKVRALSRSGGVFYHLAKQIILMGGSVYGVVLDSDNCVTYARATKIEDVKRMQGSKYVESKIDRIHSSVKEDLLAGKKVLFSGTGCQVAALNSYLSKCNVQMLNNLYLIDIVCHGVSTRKLFSDYVEFLEKKYKGKISAFNFRDKLYGWDATVESFIINGKKYCSENYISIFFSKYGMRPSCSSCWFTNYDRPSDMTLSDFWEGQQYSFNDNKGMSAIIINSEKGSALFNSVKSECECIQIDKEQCQQPRLNSPSVMPSDREDFWKLYNTKGFRTVLVKYGRYDIGRRLKFRIRLFLNPVKS